MTLKRDWGPLKRILNCVLWVGNMCEDCCIGTIGPKGFDANLMQWWHDAWMPSRCPISKKLHPKRHGCANCEWSCFGNGGPSCCLSAELQKRWHRMSSLSCSLRQGGGVCRSCKSAISIMSGLFLHNCITPSSPNCINMLYCYEYCWQCLTYEYCVLDPHSW